MNQYTLKEKREFALKMREEPTEAEAFLWFRLRGKKIGYHFQRQKLLYGWIVDFWCPKARLAIEVDGSVHDIADIAAKDEQKERVLADRKIGLLRFTNDEVLNTVTVVLRDIRRECDYLMQQQTPLRGVGFDFRFALGERIPHPVTEVGRSETVNNSAAPRPAFDTTSKRDCKSFRMPEDIPENQRITREQAEDFYRRLGAIIRHTSMEASPESIPLAQRAWEQKYRLAEYLAKKNDGKKSA